MDRTELERELKWLRCHPVPSRKAAETRTFFSRSEKRRLSERQLERKYKSKKGRTEYE